ncbi:glycosyltransferase family 2 protein [Cryobacterium glaciale]|uniref:Glycosyltransferase family 2 protein n=1 Tax=Cryobacterium glaciale TaxID=1259145 RepID=A0A4R8V007_9MICO|nr:glycosyltransferase family 2 protein [Cryobacterium glaciale]TFB74337.1 glycosyltransferase family 2 protein [Cryobacterium glaciale]
MTASGVSVALCTYNGGRFIEEQLNSILAQVVPVSEIVVSDDGSTDDTLGIVRRVAAEVRAGKTSTQIRLLDSVGGRGVTKNFERSISACRGDLIVLADQDDIWHENKLGIMLEQFDTRQDLLFLHSDARLVDGSGVPLGRNLLDALEVSAPDRSAIHSGQAFSVFLRRNLATGATSMIRRDLLKFALPFPKEWVHDEWLAIVACAVAELDFVPEALIDYRQHGQNQIGVQLPSLSIKVQRVLEPRGDRNLRLMLKFRTLVARLEALDAVAPIAPEKMMWATGKMAFEDLRSRLPAHRLLRLLPVAREGRKGSYRRYASQGWLDMFRDVLQPI